uniref:WW domain-containing protein n=2 Tax=Clytia hemisphaerica TaxID=252671 RepID=A0A7M6DL14_9CNID
MGRRRQMIQLGSSQKQVVSRNRVATPEVRDEPVEEQPKKEMDDPLAGFLAEINSLEGPASSSTAAEESRPAMSSATGTNANTQSQASSDNQMMYDPENFNPATQVDLLPENWQACLDEQTQCYYYWNVVTNEVQWYPPSAPLPPPPPPPAPEEKVESPVKRLELEEETFVEHKDEDIDSPVSLKSPVESKAEKVEKVTDVDLKSPERVEEEESASSKKEKDKVLMSQIKERIKRKKEEKIKKEREEKERLEQEALDKPRRDREEALRERLIKKKKERDDSKDDKSKDNDDLNNSLNASADSFALDMFAAAEESSSKRERKISESSNHSAKSLNDTKITKEEAKNSSKADFNPAITKTSKKPTETKASTVWRIIDYGDEESETESESEEGEIKSKKSAESAETTPQKKTHQNDEAVDNYAEMLLEDGIADEKTMIPTTKSIVEPISPVSIKTEPPIPPSPPAEPEPPSMPPPLPENEPPPPPPEDEGVANERDLKSEYEKKSAIKSKSREIFDKLDFLGINKKDIRALVLSLIELEIRLKDWEAGALSTSYLLEKIGELNKQLENHEKSAAPNGWVCHWSSDYKMYYYFETATGNSQWEYPASNQPVPTQQQVPPPPVVSMPTLPALPAFPTSHVMALQTPQMMMAAPVAPGYPGLIMSAALTTPLVAPPIPAIIPAMPPAFAPPPPQPPLPSTIEAKKRPAAPDTDVTTDPYRDPYRSVAAKKKKELSTFPDQIATQDVLSGTSSPIISSSIIAAAPAIINRNTSRESSPALIPSNENNGTFSPVAKANIAAETVLNAKAKLKKKKKVEGSGLPSKKKKQVTSMVAKWQTVKQEAEDEQNIMIEEEENEDFETQSEKRIQEWKSKIEQSGEKDYNPNFQEIKGDWRERLKRKTTT